jgi:hypothetical protein
MPTPDVHTTGAVAATGQPVVSASVGVRQRHAQSGRRGSKQCRTQPCMGEVSSSILVVSVLLSIDLTDGPVQARAMISRSPCLLFHVDANYWLLGLIWLAAAMFVVLVNNAIKHGECANLTGQLRNVHRIQSNFSLRQNPRGYSNSQVPQSRATASNLDTRKRNAIFLPRS